MPRQPRTQFVGEGRRPRRVVSEVLQGQVDGVQAARVDSRIERERARDAARELSRFLREGETMTASRHWEDKTGMHRKHDHRRVFVHCLRVVDWASITPRLPDVGRSLKT